MGTEDSTASQTIDATLSKFDVAALRRDFERLSVDDLTALASFPAEPHELIGRVVNVTHCLLLSLAPEHRTLELRAPPWPLLRLQLLDNSTKIWRKLRKRAWQLETGTKSLAPVQIRFGCKELMPFILPQKQGNDHRHGSWQLERLAQVSTIAASLGAWVVFCLCYSVLSSPSMRICHEILLPAFHDQGISAQALPSIKTPRKRDQSISSSFSKVERNLAVSKLELISVHNRCIRASRRIGIKIGGRFLLFHTRFAVYPNFRLDVDPIHEVGEWSVYCLEAHRIGRHLQKSPTLIDSYPSNASWWKPFHTIETHCSIANSLALCQLIPLAQHSFLIQLGFHSHIFERPVQDIPHAKTPPYLPPVFTLKFDAVMADFHSQFSLLGIGNVWITMGTTVADLRNQLTLSIVSLVCGDVDRQIAFQFIYRGSMLAVSQERHLAAVALLPFTMIVVVADNYHVKTVNRPSQLWRHHNDVSQALVNAGLPDHMPHTQSLHVPESTITFPKTPQVYAMRQPFSADTSTSSVIVEIFTHWQAFVYFQQLQDSSVLFQLPRRSPKKQTKSPRKSPKHRLNNDQDDAQDKSVPYGPQPQPLPRKKFNSTKEWLLPLYAVVDVQSPTTAVLKSPFRLDVQQALCFPCRLALAEEVNVIHFTRINCVATDCDNVGVQLAMFDITFIRDESCSLDSLINLKAAYVWLIVPRKPRKDQEIPAVPTEWMIDLYRFIQHPAYDFQSSNHQQISRFRVHMPSALAERTIEAVFWSKDVDWELSMSSTDLYFTMLRQIFDMLCRSHPPALGVDSVKFSKLLYEAKIQPKLLSIGDAAFLFASNLTPGLYEMDFGGFVCAVEWVAQQFYSENGAKGKPSPSKTQFGIQHGMMKWQLSRHGEHNPGDHLLSSLRRFCYETLVHLPSLTSTWREIMNSWRLERKQQLMQQYAIKYCAATRLRATWIGFVTWRIFLHRRQRMREERQAGTKLQSLVRGRWQYLEYQRVRRIIIRTQRRIHARSELRRLRADQAVFVEHMRLRLVKWMRHHLWLLRMWKRLNVKIVARRDRIREKRLRRLGVGIFPLETRRVRFSLYRAKPITPTNTEDSATTNSTVENLSNCPDEQQDRSDDAFELEVVDPIRSWGHVFCVSQQQVDQFIAEEVDRQELQLLLGFTTVSMATDKKTSSSVPMQNQRLHESKQVKGVTVRDSIVYPRLKPNLMLLTLARRLFILTDVQHGPVGLRCYSDPTETSMGKLVFKGVLRSQYALDNVHGELFIQRHIVRVLEWAGTFKFLMYTPATSARSRYDLDAQFILAVLQFSRFQSMRLIIHEDDDAIDEDREEQAKTSGVGTPSDGQQQFIPYRIHRILNGPHKLQALQCILSYVLQHGLRTPTYSMMPHVIAERERQRQEHEFKQRNAILNRERQLVVMVQARVRQHIARNTRLQLALASYSKYFDQERRQFVYVLQYRSGQRIDLGERKPFSLFDQDVPLPPDEWQLVSAADKNTRFFNPRHGIYSRFNDSLAATIIQHWYRGKMWDGISNWKLSDIDHAQRYYTNVQKPTMMSDPGQLENLKRYALQLHVLQYEYKAAYPIYEAALKISPNDPQTLVCLATLLVISCRYPVAQSWQRALAYLQQARELVGDEITTTLHEVEQNGFRWALFLQPKNPQAIANYAVYHQCVYLDIDQAELLYRRALDLDPANDLFVTNFQRLQSERAPGRLYAFAGPGNIALARSFEVRRFEHWREMEDHSAQPPIPKRFYHDLRTGKCAWELSAEGQSLPDPSEAPLRITDTKC